MFPGGSTEVQVIRAIKLEDSLFLLGVLLLCEVSYKVRYED